MLSNAILKAKYAQALRYDDYLAAAAPNHRESWHAVHHRAWLDDAQYALLSSFTRRVHILALSGAWCGDCAQQLPFLARFEQANPDLVQPRFLDRDDHADLSERLRISDGLRVPLVIYMNEDFDFISLFGDRSLSRYRALAARALGPSCPLPGAPVDGQELRATLADWLDELERVHLLCRLSPKLRARYRD